VNEFERQAKNESDREAYGVGAWIGVGAFVYGILGARGGDPNTLQVVGFFGGPLVSIVCLVLRGQVPKS